MLTIWDYAVIIFYLLFMMAIGFVWKSVSKNSSDYFRGGGNMLWWLSGMSSLAAGLTAYSFTAAGAFVYKTGFLLLFIYMSGFPGMLLIYFFLAPRFRQMRVVTTCDAIRRRYGRITEQFWVWTALPIGLFSGGMMLYVIALFVSTALDMNIYFAIVILALVITIMAGAGGSWAVAASDFLQMMIIIVVSITVLIRTFSLPTVGGVSGFLEKMPEKYINFNEFARLEVWLPWLLVLILINTMRSADLNTVGAKYLSVKDGDNAKKATLLNMCGLFIVPIIAFTPVMAMSLLDLNLAEMYPALKDPGEGAYLAIASYVLPQGMIGLMICAIFAATMSSMDTALNKNAGFFVKNFYIEFVRPGADEKEQLMMGKVFSVFFGCIVMVVAMLVAQYRGGDLFSLLNRLAVILVYPMVIPMVGGTLFRRTPGWAAWSTVLICLPVGYFSQVVVTPEMINQFFEFAEPFNKIEAPRVMFIFSAAFTLSIGISWYFFTSFFYKQTSEKFKGEVDGLFKDMATPIDHKKEHDGNQDLVQYKLIGLLCLVYGGVIMLGIFIPNSLSDRLIFIYNGGAIALVGGILFYIYIRRQKTLNSKENSDDILDDEIVS